MARDISSARRRPYKGLYPTTPSASLEDLVSRVVPAVALVQAGSSRGTGFFIARATAC